MRAACVVGRVEWSACLALGAYLGLGLPRLAVLHLDLDGVDLLQLVQYLVKQVRGVVDQHVHELQE
jgi:hypothetical protein